jgi:hypothetical protein
LGARFKPRLVAIADTLPTRARPAASPFAEDFSHPFLVVEVPSNRLADSLLEAVGWHPAKFFLDFGGVNRVAAVVAGTILDKRDQLARMSAGLR